MRFIRLGAVCTVVFLLLVMHGQALSPIQVSPTELTAVKAAYKKQVEAGDENDPQGHETLAIWCHNRGFKAGYIRHHRVFLESRGENARKKDPDGYCRVCNGQEEYLCNKCDSKRRVAAGCKECNGRGKVKCSRCLGTGKVNCKACKGRGQRKKSSYVMTGRGGYTLQTRTIPCAPKSKCGVCRGKDLIQCNPCRGTGAKKKGGTCTDCNGYRFRSCTACAQRYQRLQRRIQSSYLAWKRTAAPKTSEKKEVLVAEDVVAEEITETQPPGLEGEGNQLAAKGDALLTEGLALDKQSLTAGNPFPLMKKAAEKYEGAIRYYKAARKAGSDVEENLTEASKFLFWVRKMMPIK